MTFNVADYGADGTGARDATDSVQRAVAAAEAIGGGMVVFPEGTYRLDGTVMCKSSNMRFWGAGRASIIKKTSAATQPTALRFSKPRTTIRGVEVAFLSFVSDRRTSNADVAMVDFAVGTENLNDIEVHHCRFTLPHDGSIALLFACAASTTIDNVRIHDNVFEDCQYSSIAINNSFSPAYRVNRVSICRNHLRNAGDFPITCAGPITALVVSENYVKQDGGDYGVEIVGPKGCILSNNVFEGKFDVAVIGSSGSPSNPVGQDVLIEGNVSVGTLAGGFVLQNLSRAVIRNNQLRYSGTMVFSGVGNGCTVSLVDNWLEAPTPYVANDGANVYSLDNRFGTARPLANPWRDFKDTGAGSASSVQMTFNGLGLSSWRPVGIRVRVVQVAPDGGGGGMAERLFMLRMAQGETAVTTVNTSIVESGVALTISLGTNSCTITAKATGGVVGVRQLWRIDYDTNADIGGSGVDVAAVGFV
jgi:hypothetical protein